MASKIAQIGQDVIAGRAFKTENRLDRLRKIVNDPEACEAIGKAFCEQQLSKATRDIRAACSLQKYYAEVLGYPTDDGPELDNVNDLGYADDNVF